MKAYLHIYMQIWLSNRRSYFLNNVKPSGTAFDRYINKKNVFNLSENGNEMGSGRDPKVMAGFMGSTKVIYQRSYILP